ncbi:hypothetical protein [Nonomuraea sp. NPDC002799]
MLKDHLRRDLESLKRQTRKDRRITAVLLAGVLAAWARQLSPWPGAPGFEVLLGISLALVLGSGVAWLISAYFVARTVLGRRTEESRWIARVNRSKEWAFCSVSAYVAWHLLQFVTALLLG